jgi:sugar/nucleoside kinase (ribokinase family)
MIIPNGPLNPPQAAIALAAGRPRRLVFAGEAIVDVLMRVPGLPSRGGDLLATSAQIAVGGGFNVMAAAARQGLPVLYAGGHGSGPWGDLVRAALTAEGIGLLRPPDPSRDTGFDVALVEPDAERTFVTMLGAESAAEPGGWDAVPAGPGDAVYVSGYGLVPPSFGPALGAWAASLPPAVLLFVDPGPLVAQIPPEVLDPVLARCDWLSCNAREAALLTGVTAQEAAFGLLTRTARASVIVRVGPDGCFLATRQPASHATPPSATNPSRPAAGQATRLPAPDAALTPGAVPASGAAPAQGAAPAPDARSARDAPTSPVHIPAPTVRAVDTTGAGDAHSGVFLAALADGLSPEAAARRANAAAALAVTRPGPATTPDRAELNAWLARR